MLPISFRYVFRSPAGAAHVPSLSDETTLDVIREKLQRFQAAEPVISIVIPAYNEEGLLLRTLHSIANQQTQFPVELIVANNNSTDRTQELLDRCGVRSLFVRQQGVAHARQAGLQAARGRYVVNADADCWYPPTWLDALVTPLLDPSVSCTYGPHSFLPQAHTARLPLSLYEWCSEGAAQLRRAEREFVNVLGMNFAFRRADGLAVGGFNLASGHQGTVSAAATGQAGRCEDGWMALSLQKLGRLQPVFTDKARVWTSDRRLLADGSLRQAFIKRLRREIGRLSNTGRVGSVTQP